jgi:hypothetical protein
MNKEEYRSNKLFALFHALENRLYPTAHWISHTNEERCKLFVGDVGEKIEKVIRVLPNYPPKAWISLSRKQKFGGQKKVIYVGALDLNTMYVREFAEWIEAQQGDFIWHIYSQQSLEDLSVYLGSIKSEYISVKGYVSYDELPELLATYNIGVILYKPTTENFIYNAPNKLFEYLICDLDVWYPAEMKGIDPYKETLSRPKVIPVLFSDTKSLDKANYMSQHFDRGSRKYCAEDVLGYLKDELLKDHDVTR